MLKTPTFRSASLSTGLLAGVLLLTVACSGSSAAHSTADLTSTAPAAPTISPTATPPPPSPTPNAYANPSGTRILDYDRQLTVDIGPRPAGSAKEKQTAELLANTLRGFGYEVEMQTFSSSTATGRESTLSLNTPDQRTVPNVPFAGSSETDLTAPVVLAGGGATGDFPPATKGAIALVTRGDIFFRDILANALAAGVTGLIVMNNVPGTFFGSVEGQATIPVVAISQAEGDNLARTLANGPVQARLSVIDYSTSVNVIARPPGRQCETISGGHYDTVAVSPGASDNSSGTATVIEVAGVLAARNEMGANCFVLFAAEEPGLLGSKYFVSTLDAAAKQRLKVMLNFDMTGVTGTKWQMITSNDLLDNALAVAAQENVAAESPGFVRSDSDHWSFYQAGLPIVWLYAGADPLFHTPRDTIEHIQLDSLEQAARFGIAFLEAINTGG